MLIYFKSRSKARSHAQNVKAKGHSASVSESLPNAVTGSRYAVKLNGKGA